MLTTAHRRIALLTGAAPLAVSSPEPCAPVPQDRGLTLNDLRYVKGELERGVHPFELVGPIL